MKYKSELIHEILEQRGHEKSTLHYQSECVKSWVDETKGAYPKLCDYESEWLNYINENPIGEFPYETVTTNNTATVNNVVPFEYKSAILSGSTKYRDIDTGEFLETFEEGRNLELVSVKMPVLTTTGKNLLKTKTATFNFEGNKQVSELVGYVKVEKNKQYTVSFSFQKNIDSNSGSGVEIVGCNDIPEESLKYWYASNDSRCKLFNKNSSITEKSTINNFKYTIPSDHDVNYIAIYCGSYFKEYVGIVENVQIETGTTATPYEPHKSNILTVNEEVVLRGFDSVEYTLNLNTGECVKRIGELTLDGSEHWLSAINDDGTMRFNHSISDFKNYGDGSNGKNLINNKLPKVTFSTSGNRYGVTTWCNRVIFYTEHTNVNDFKQWLSQNPITVQYELETPVVKTVDLTVVNQDGEPLSKIKPIEGTMHVEVSGTPIVPTAVLEVPVEAITQNLNSFIEEE